MDPPGRAVFSIASDEGARRLFVSGEIDLATAPRMEAALETLVADGTEPIVVELAELEFIDATGVQVLLAAAAEASAQGRHFGLRGAPEMTRRMVELLGGDTGLFVE